MTNHEQIKGLVWNIQSGGFSSYDTNGISPEREPQINSVLLAAKQVHSIDTVTLTDAYRWDEVYGGDNGIAEHLGYGSANFQELNDDRLTSIHGKGVGIVFATDKKIQQSQAIDLETRQGLGVILDVGAHGLQIANVYLDDLSEEVRMAQVKALINGIEPDVPTILVGDFNALRADMSRASLGTKAANLAVRALAKSLPKKGELGITVAGMNKRQAVPALLSLGFNDADEKRKRPTAPSKLPLFGVDYVFHNKKARVTDLDIHSNKDASDHASLTYTARV